MKYDRIWFVYVIVHYCYTVVALYVYSKFTSLGDTFDYLNMHYFDFSRMLTNSTYFIGTIASISNSFLGVFVTSLVFCSLALFGVYYSIAPLGLTKGQRLFALSILSTPTFSIWTSVVSKESIVVFSLGLILGNIFYFVKVGRFRSIAALFLGLYLCIFFKPLYATGLISVLFFLICNRFFVLRAKGNFFLIFLFIFSVAFILWVFSDLLNYVIAFLPAHFSLSAASTRENTFFVSENDIFWNAPVGIFLSLTGPTFSEAINKATHLIVFIESYILFTVFVLMVCLLFLRVFKSLRFNPFFCGLILTGCLWILLVNYPFGVLNPGSAMRYRSNFFAYFFLILFSVVANSLPGHIARKRKKYRA